MVTGITSRTDYTAISIADNIKNPTTFNNHNISNDPYSPTYRNMWDAKQIDEYSTQCNSSATIKTIYDPCPPRFCVPTDNLYYFMGRDGEDARLLTTWNSYGANWNINITGESVFFPALGYRRCYDASVNEMKESGYYWSATNGYDCGNALYFWKTPAARYWEYIQENRLAHGYAIRAVVEE